jgi:hypothetical protein
MAVTMKNGIFWDVMPFFNMEMFFEDVSEESEYFNMNVNKTQEIMTAECSMLMCCSTVQNT